MDAIHKVVEEGDLRQTKSLLDRRKYAMSRDKDGNSLLHKAVMNGRTEVAEYLASTYPEILNLTDAVSTHCGPLVHADRAHSMYVRGPSVVMVHTKVQTILCSGK